MNINELNIINQTFSLTTDQTLLMFKFKDMITSDQSNFAFAKNKKDKNEKSDWRYNWRKYIENELRKSIPNCSLMTISSNKLLSKIQEETQYDEWKYLVFIECICFQPFFDLGNKNTKNLKIDEKTYEKSLQTIAEQLGIRADLKKRIEKELVSTYKDFTFKWWKIAVKVATVIPFLFFPFGNIALLGRIIGTIGYEATYFAICGGVINVALSRMAISSGVSFALAGISLFTDSFKDEYIESVAESSPKYVLAEAVKAFVAIKVIYAEELHDKELIEELVRTTLKRKTALKTRLNQLKTRANYDKNQIEQLTESIGYYDRFYNAVEKLDQSNIWQSITGDAVLNELKYQLTARKKEYTNEINVYKTSKIKLDDEIQHHVETINNCKIGIKEGSFARLKDKLQQLLKFSTQSFLLENIQSVDLLLGQEGFWKDVEALRGDLHDVSDDLDFLSAKNFLLHKQIDKAKMKMEETTKKLDTMKQCMKSDLEQRKSLKDSLEFIANIHNTLKEQYNNMLSILDPVVEYSFLHQGTPIKLLPQDLQDRFETVWSMTLTMKKLAETRVFPDKSTDKGCNVEEYLKSTVKEIKELSNKYKKSA